MSPSHTDAVMLVHCPVCDVCEGFMCGTTVVDKDGISAAVVTAEMTAYLASQGTTVLQQLSHLHDKSVSFFVIKTELTHAFCFLALQVPYVVFTASLCLSMLFIVELLLQLVVEVLTPAFLFTNYNSFSLKAYDV